MDTTGEKSWGEGFLSIVTLVGVCVTRVDSVYFLAMEEGAAG